MMIQEATKAIQLEGLSIEAKAVRMLEFSQGLVKAESALKCIDEIIEVLLEEEDDTCTCEIICRKLKKYKFLSVEDGYYTDTQKEAAF